jgi:hypothetical protein
VCRGCYFARRQGRAAALAEIAACVAELAEKTRKTYHADGRQDFYMRGQMDAIDHTLRLVRAMGTALDRIAAEGAK